MKQTLLIKNGRLIDPANQIDRITGRLSDRSGWRLSRRPFLISSCFMCGLRFGSWLPRVIDMMAMRTAIP